MGIIIKQSIKGTIWIYLGVLIGFFTTAYIYPNYLTPEVVGLFGLLVSISDFSSSIFQLGFLAVTTRLFPYFRDPGKGHKGFLFIALIFHIVGICLFLITYKSLTPWLIRTNIEKSPLFAQYIYLLIPLTIARMIFTFLDTYNKVLYNAVIGHFLQDFLQRILVLVTAFLFVIGTINLHQLILLYVISLALKTLIILSFLLKRKEINLKANFSILDKKMKKEIANVAIFSLIGGLGSIIVFNLDKIILNQLLDLSHTGVYFMGFYFATLINKPSKPLLKISGSLIADAWKVNDTKQIFDIYYKSCLNQIIIGGFLFLGLWINIDNILFILGDDYLQVKWVIFFIGLGYLIDMSTGVNSIVIGTSKYYRVGLFFICTLIIVTLSLMFLLIPKFGIVGAAIAISIALFFNNFLRYLFILWKYKMQPFNIKHLIIILFFVVLYFLINLIPQQKVILDIIIRGTLITVLSGLFFWIFPASKEIQSLINTLWKRLGKLISR